MRALTKIVILIVTLVMIDQLLKWLIECKTTHFNFMKLCYLLISINQSKGEYTVLYNFTSGYTFCFWQLGCHHAIPYINNVYNLLIFINTISKFMVPLFSLLVGSVVNLLIKPSQSLRNFTKSIEWSSSYFFPPP